MGVILCFEEKDRVGIEARGITIIEFKRQLYNAEKVIGDVRKLLREIVDKVARAWNVFAEKILEAIDTAELLFEQIREAYYYPTSRRYRIVKVFSKCTGMDIRFCWKITWEIRRWIVRNRCKYLSGLL